MGLMPGPKKDLEPDETAFAEAVADGVPSLKFHGDFVVQPRPHYSQKDINNWINGVVSYWPVIPGISDNHTPINLNVYGVISY